MNQGGGHRRLLRGGAGIAVAMAVMNVATYGFTMLAARILGPRPYGALASLMAVLLVVSVVQLGLQATAARRIAADPGHVDQIESTILRVTYRAAIGVGVLLLALSPLLDLVLRLDSLPTAALVALAAVPVTVMGGQAGVLQGERRWGPLALLYVAAGVPRLLVGLALLLWSPSETSAMAAVVLGAMAPVAVGYWALRGARPQGERHERHTMLPVLRETVGNSQALLAFFALSNVDVILARNVLDDHDAGLYAGGLIVVKAVLFLPQFVVVVAFPSMSNAAERRDAMVKGLAVVAGLGAVSTAAAAVLPDLALVFVGGDEYAEIAGRLWVFAVIGTLLSMLQLLVYSVLARQGRYSTYLVWAVLVAVVLGGLAVDTIDQLLTVVTAADAALFVVLLGISLAVLRRTSPRDPADVTI